MVEFVKSSVEGSRDNVAAGALANGYSFVVVNALDPLTEKRAAGAVSIADETRICLERLSVVLGKQGLSLRDVIKANGFLASNDYRGEFWGTYKEFFEPGPYPARCTYAVGLPADCRVQLDIVALSPGAA